VDIIENMMGSVVQHGPHNDRIYLMRLQTDDTQALIAALDDMAITNGYGKIFAKIPATAWHTFKNADYVKEAVIPGFFTGKIDGFFIAKHFTLAKQITHKPESASRFVLLSKKKPGDGLHTGKVKRDVASCKPSDAGEMSAIYRQIFSSYPFPIQQPDYIQRMMKETTRYYCIRMKGRIAAIAAAEIDSVSQNAEMTDFATLPKWRGMGLAGSLLNHMEMAARKRGIQTAFTIARAQSAGMNSVFRKSGYSYAGLLKNNTQICGSIQSMVVWYKHL